jgi:RNA polymerase sigma-70 factor, ECF subfamily
VTKPGVGGHHPLRDGEWLGTEQMVEVNVRAGKRPPDLQLLPGGSKNSERSRGPSPRDAASTLNQPPPAPMAAGQRGRMPQTFDELYEEYFAFVWRSLRMMGVYDEALDDASQDVFCVAYRRWPEFRGDSSLHTWLFGIVQGIASNHRRSVRRTRARLEALADAPATQEPSPEDLARAAERADLVLSFSAALDESRRAVFVLGLLEKVPAAEIAALVGIPLNTVYSRLRKLRNSLQAWLEQHEVEGE